MFRRCRPLVCSTATGVSFGAQHPTGRTACVGCTASPNRTASSSPSWFRRFSYALIKAACLSGSSLHDTAFGLRCSIPRLAIPAAAPPEPSASLAQPMQQRDQARAALIDDATFVLDPGAHLAGGSRQRLGDPRFQLILLLIAQAARAALIAKARQAFDPVFLIQPIPSSDGIVIQH